MRKTHSFLITITLLFAASLNAQTTQTAPASTAPQDSSLTYCTSDATCAADLPGQGKGCFRMTEDDLFSGDAQNENQFLTLSDQQDKVDEDREANGVDVGDDRDGLKDGSACDSSSKCDSYFCDPTTKLCTEKKICRHADLGEAVSPGVACEEGYIINAQGICDLTEEDKKLLYMGLIEGDLELKTTDNSCDMKRFQTDPVVKDIRDKSIVSMKTLRAMEWLFATSSLEEKDECLKVLPYLRDEMAKKYNDERKKILTNFNIEMAKIEKDSETIKNAKKGSEEMVNVHGQEIKEGDLESRKQSGYDAMMIMYRRNLLFQAYEKAMSEIIKEAGTKVGGLAEEMGNWKDKSKKWTVGGKEWTYKTAGKCRGKKAKKIKKRWANYYQVKATTEANAEIVNRPAIADYLTLVSGESQDSVKNVLKNGPKSSRFSNYFLVDPLMPGGKGKIDFEKFGTGKKGKRRLGANAYPELYKAFRANIVEFYKGMKGTGAPQGFVYEPEIISSEARDCMEKPEGPNCDAYTRFIDEMTDVAFAQFLAYSIHSKNSYKKYFPKADNLRRKLLAKYEVDMQNVVKYYDTMNKARDDQSQCLEKNINSVAEQFLGDTSGVSEGLTGEQTTGETSGAQGGATSGADAGSSVNNPGGPSVSGAALTGSTPASSATGGSLSTTSTGGGSRLGSSGFRLDQGTRLSFQPNLRATSNTGSASAAGSANISAASGQFAIRLEKMKKANAAAVNSRVDIKAKEKNTEESFRNLSMTFSGSQSGGGPQLASLNGSAAVLDVIPQKIQDKSAIDLRSKTIGIQNGGTAETASAVAATAPIGPSSASPASVLSNSDIENMEVNYERTKNRYKSDEADELFEKVSKAYVRNLDRVLTKKKGPEE